MAFDKNETYEQYCSRKGITNVHQATIHLAIDSVNAMKKYSEGLAMRKKREQEINEKIMNTQEKQLEKIRKEEEKGLRLRCIELALSLTHGDGAKLSGEDLINEADRMYNHIVGSEDVKNIEYEDSINKHNLNLIVREFRIWNVNWDTGKSMQEHVDAFVNSLSQRYSVTIKD